MMNQIITIKIQEACPNKDETAVYVFDHDQSVAKGNWLQGVKPILNVSIHRHV